MFYKISHAWTDENVTQLSLKSSQNNFVAIVDLPEGEHQYKFCVDGQWTLDPTGVREGSNLTFVKRFTNLPFIFTAAINV